MNERLLLMLMYAVRKYIIRVVTELNCNFVLRVICLLKTNFTAGSAETKLNEFSPSGSTDMKLN